MIPGVFNTDIGVVAGTTPVNRLFPVVLNTYAQLYLDTVRGVMRSSGLWNRSVVLLTVDHASARRL